MTSPQPLSLSPTLHPGVTYRPAEAYRTALAAAKAALELSLAAVEGAAVEDNTFAISVHYRHVAGGRAPPSPTISRHLPPSHAISPRACI